MTCVGAARTELGGVTARSLVFIQRAKVTYAAQEAWQAARRIRAFDESRLNRAHGPRAAPDRAP